MLRTNSPGNVMPPTALSLGRTSAIAGASKCFKFSLCDGNIRQYFFGYFLFVCFVLLFFF